jgi:hypothetical protein
MTTMHTTEDQLIDQNTAKDAIGMSSRLYLETLRRDLSIPRAKIGRRVITKRSDWLAMIVRPSK